MNKCRKNKDIREGEKDTGDFYTDFLHNLRVLQSFHSLKDFIMIFTKLSKRQSSLFLEKL
jgi:hypothetical protein